MRIVARMRQHSDMAVGHVLVLLIEKGPQRVGEIAQALGTDPSTVSRKVAALVDAGLVERRVDPDDGRAHLLAATAEGERKCVDGRRQRIDMITAVLSGWPPKTPGANWPTLLARFADGSTRPTDPRTTERTMTTALPRQQLRRRHARRR